MAEFKPAPLRNSPSALTNLAIRSHHSYMLMIKNYHIYFKCFLRSILLFQKKNGERSVSTLGSLYLPGCVRDTAWCCINKEPETEFIWKRKLYYYLSASFLELVKCLLREKFKRLPLKILSFDDFPPDK